MHWIVRHAGAGLAALFFATAAQAGFFDDYVSDGLGYESHRTYFVKLEGGATLQKIGGETRIGGSGNSKIDFQDDLDIGDDKSYWTRLDFQPFLRHHLRFTYTPLRFKGSENNVPLTIDGVGFSGEEVDSDFKLDSYAFAYRWDAMYIGERVTLSPIIGAELLDGKIELDNKTGGVTNVSENESFFVPVPTLGLRMEGFPFTRLGFYGEAKGMTIGKKATTWNAEAGFEFHVIDNISVNARYRYSKYDLDVSGFELKSNLSGPYVGLGFRF